MPPSKSPYMKQKIVRFKIHARQCRSTTKVDENRLNKNRAAKCDRKIAGSRFRDLSWLFFEQTYWKASEKLKSFNNFNLISYAVWMHILGEISASWGCDLMTRKFNCWKHISHSKHARAFLHLVPFASFFYCSRSSGCSILFFGRCVRIIRNELN